MTISVTPGRLVRDDGRVNFGVFEAPVADLNYLDFEPPGGRGKVRPSRIKRWEYIGLAGPDFILGGAVVSLSLVGNAFFYVFDRKTRELKEYSALAPLCRGIEFDSNGAQGRVSFVKGGQRMVLDNDREAGLHRFEVAMGDVRVRAELRDRLAPLVCATRVGYHGFNYTLKLAGMAAGGEVVIGGRRYELDPERTFGVIDYTTGRLARETFWNWAAGGGRSEDGRSVGINLVQGVNETGYTENAFWVGDRLVKTDTVTFEYDDRAIISPWRVRSQDGKVDLGFTPEGVRSEHLNFGIMASRFYQPFGSFAGTLRDDDGKILKVGLSGYTEEHYAKW